MHRSPISEGGVFSCTPQIYHCTQKPAFASALEQRLLQASRPARSCCVRTPRARSRLGYTRRLRAMCKARVMSWLPQPSHPPSIAARQPREAPTPAELIAATQRRDAAQVQVLLARGADPTVQTRKRSAVHDGSHAIVRLLLDAGANVNARRCLPLILAVDAGHLSMVQLLLERGADPNDNGEPYRLAQHTRRDDIVRALLESGATPVLGEPATRSSSDATSEPTAHAIERPEHDNTHFRLGMKRQNQTSLTRSTRQPLLVVILKRWLTLTVARWSSQSAPLEAFIHRRRRRVLTPTTRCFPCTAATGPMHGAGIRWGTPRRTTSRSTRWPTTSR